MPTPNPTFPRHPHPRTWLLTAATSPIGITTARHLLAHGDNVLAGIQHARIPESQDGDAEGGRYGERGDAEGGGGDADRDDAEGGGGYEETGGGVRGSGDGAREREEAFELFRGEVEREGWGQRWQVKGLSARCDVPFLCCGWL